MLLGYNLDIYNQVLLEIGVWVEEIELQMHCFYQEYGKYNDVDTQLYLWAS